MFPAYAGMNRIDPQSMFILGIMYISSQAPSGFLGDVLGDFDGLEERIAELLVCQAGHVVHLAQFLRARLVAGWLDGYLAFFPHGYPLRR